MPGRAEENRTSISVNDESVILKMAKDSTEFCLLVLLLISKAEKKIIIKIYVWMYLCIYPEYYKELTIFRLSCILPHMTALEPVIFLEAY